MRRASRHPGVALAPAGVWMTASAAHAQTVRTVAEAMPGAASSPLPLRRDADAPAFPMAGAVFLLILVLASVAAWWHRRRQGGLSLPGLAGRAIPVGTLRVTATVRLDVHTRLHAVEWEGRRLLLAVGGSATPVVIDRIEGEGGAQGLSAPIPVPVPVHPPEFQA